MPMKVILLPVVTLLLINLVTVDCLRCYTCYNCKGLIASSTCATWEGFCMAHRNVDSEGNTLLVVSVTFFFIQFWQFFFYWQGCHSKLCRCLSIPSEYSVSLQLIQLNNNFIFILTYWQVLPKWSLQFTICNSFQTSRLQLLHPWCFFIVGF